MIEIAESLLTEEFIVRIYEYLTVTRTKEKMSNASGLAEGQFDGYLACLEDLFGIASDEEADKAADEEKSITHVVDRIMASMSREMDPYIKKARKGQLEFSDWMEVSKLVKEMVREYAINNWNDCVDGIKSM